MKKFNFDGFENHYTQLFSKAKIPGAALTIVKNNAVLYEKGYGVRSLTSQQSVTGDTVFPIASLSKSFSGLLLALMCQDGYVDFDDPVLMHLPDFNVGPVGFRDKVLLSDLLSHRLGLVSDDIGITVKTKGWKEAVKELGNLIPVAPYGTQYHYFNTTYWVVALLIEKYYGQDWQTFLKDRVLTPLGIFHPCLTLKEYETRDHANLYQAESQEEIPLWSFEKTYGPAGGLMMSIKHLQLYMQFYLNEGSVDSQQIVEKKYLQRLYHPYTTINPVPDYAALATEKYNLHHYGLGFKIGNIKGEPLYYHEGSIPGVRSILVLIPSQKIGASILTNSGGHDWCSDALFYWLDRLFE